MRQELLRCFIHLLLYCATIGTGACIDSNAAQAHGRNQCRWRDQLAVQQPCAHIWRATSNCQAAYQQALTASAPLLAQQRNEAALPGSDYMQKCNQHKKMHGPRHLFTACKLHLLHSCLDS